jgi:hypothetical protein
MPMLQRRSKPVKGSVDAFLASGLGLVVVLGEVSLDFVGLASVEVGVVSCSGEVVVVAVDVVVFGVDVVGVVVGVGVVVVVVVPGLFGSWL